MTIRRVRVVGNTALVEVQPRNGGSPTVVPAPLVQVAAAPYAPSGGLMAGTSDTPNMIVTGAMEFTMNEYGLGFITGQTVQISETANPTVNWMSGVVTSYVEPLLTVNIQNIPVGPPTTEISDWSIGVSGMKGLTGNTGPVGPQGPTGQVPEAPLDGNHYNRRNGAWANADAIYAPIASPTFTGTARAPTPANAVNDTTLATCAFVHSVTGSAITEAPTDGAHYSRQSSAWASIDPLLAAKAPLASPIFTGTPQGPTPTAGDNSVNLATTAFCAALVANYMPLAGGTFSGAVSAPTPAPGDNSTKLATTGFVTASFAPLASPVFTGIPQAPNPPPNDNSTALATTLWVRNTITTISAGYATLASPAFTGDPQAPTQPAGDNDQSIATTAFVSNAIAAAGTGTGLSDSPQDGKAYGRLSGNWNQVLPFLYGPTLMPAVVPPGILTGYADQSQGDYFQIQALRTASSPYSDGAYIILGGPTYGQPGGPGVFLFAGTRAGGYKGAVFKPNGCLGLPNDPIAALDAATKEYVDNAIGAAQAFPSGTVMLFYQATAPTGWTKVTTQNDKLLRVVSGTTGGGGGGTNNFSTVNAQTVVGNHTLTAAEAPVLSGSWTAQGYGLPYTPTGTANVGCPGGGPYNAPQSSSGWGNLTGGPCTINSGGGGAHNHAITMNIAYCDVIIASKN